jgi:hypothetical protein
MTRHAQISSAIHRAQNIAHQIRGEIQKARQDKQQIIGDFAQELCLKCGHQEEA